MGKVYEMLWDCQFCGTKHNLGLSHRFCPTCGAPQNPDARYYPSDEDKKEVENHQYVGVDVTCPACNQLNSSAAEFCGQCGSPLTAGAKAKTLEEESMAEGGQFVSSGSRDVTKEKFEAEMMRVGVMPDKKKNGEDNINRILMGIIGVLIVGIILAAVAFMWKRETQVVVSGHEWERTINIQTYRQFTERNWRDSRPSGDNVSMGSCSRQQRSTNRVPDGQECRTVRRDQGDGTFREERVCETKYREEPVYDDMCTWTGYRWTASREATSSGSSLAQSPAWANANLRCANQSSVGCERESGREERYTVIYRGTEDEATYRCDFEQNIWASVPIESLWKAQVRVLVGGSMDCATLERAS